AYLFLLQSYRLEGRKEPPPTLKVADLQEILIGYRLLLDPSIEGGVPSLQKEVTQWVREEVLPQFQSLSKADQGAVLSRVIHAERARQKLPPLREGIWHPVEEKPSLFRLELPDQEIFVDLEKPLQALPSEASKALQKEIPIPDSLL